MSDLYKTLLISRPQVLSSGGSGLLVAANNLSDVADAATARTNLGVSSITTQASNDSGRKKEGYLYSDGATSNRAQVQTPGARGNLAGAPLASWVGWVEVPTTNPANNTALIATIGPGSGNNNSTANALNIGLGNGVLTILESGTVGYADRREFSWGGFLAAYAGQRVWLEIRLTFGATNPVVRANGVNISANFSATAVTSGAGIPNWLDSGLLATTHTSGSIWPAGTAPLGCWLNAHLTDAESETWRLTGRPPVWVAAGGHRAFPNQVFSGITGFPWDSFTGATVTGFTASQATNTTRYGNAPLGFTVPRNGAVRVSFTANLISGQAPTVDLSESGVGKASSLVTVVNGINSVLLTASLRSGNAITFETTQATNYSISGFTVEIFGALSLPAVQSINVLEDITAIGGNQARLVGMTPVVLDSVPVSTVERPAEAYTTTSIRLLGGDIIGARKRRILAVTGNSSASVNLSLGTSSGGTQLVNAQAVNGDFDISTFASRILAANSSLWLTFSGSTTASIHIHLTDI